MSGLLNIKLSHKIDPWQRLWLINALALLLITTGCAYFNTFYNAKNYYQQGRKLVVNDTLKLDSELFDKAIEKSVTVIVKYPASRWTDDALLIMGASYYYKGDYQRALEKLDALIAAYPESPRSREAVYYRGLCYYKLGQYPSAILQLYEVMNTKQFQKRAQLALAYVHYRQGNYQSLAQITDSLLQQRLIARERQQVLTLQAEAQFNLGRYDEALVSYQNLLKATIAPEDKRRLKLKIGKTYAATGRYQESQSFLEGEEDPEFKVLLAEVQYQLGDTLEAQQNYRDLIASNRGEYLALAYYKLAEQLERLDSTNAAIAYYDSAYQRGSGDYAGRSQDRSTLLKRISFLESDTVAPDRSLFLLAELYYVDLNDLPRALQLYRRVDSAYAASPWAAKALYARFWITKNLLGQDSLARVLAQELHLRYPRTEYDHGAGLILQRDSLLAADTLFRQLKPDTTDTAPPESLWQP